MKKILLFMAILPMLFLTACSSDDDDKETYTIKNLSGVNWYDVDVCIMSSGEDDAELLEMIDAGDVAIGETCTISSDHSYFYISAKNSRGKMFMSKVKYLSKDATVSSRDILVNL